MDLYLIIADNYKFINKYWLLLILNIILWISFFKYSYGKKNTYFSVVGSVQVYFTILSYFFLIIQFYLLFLVQGLCTLMNMRVNVPVLAARLIFNCSPCARLAKNKHKITSNTKSHQELNQVISKMATVF